MEVLISNIDYHKVGFNQACLKHKAISIRGAKNIYYSTIMKIFEEKISYKKAFYGRDDIILDNKEQTEVKLSLEKILSELIKEKEEKPEGMPDTRKVLGKNIHIYLRDRNDVVISVFSKILSITEECINENKPMYFSVVQENV